MKAQKILSALLPGAGLALVLCLTAAGAGESGVTVMVDGAPLSGGAYINENGSTIVPLRALAEAQKKPVTIKIRKGFDDAHLNAAEIARIAEANGAAAVAVHGRTREQYYSGRADWEAIRQVKEAVRIPVIGNGDVDSPAAAEEMLRLTGCDGVMIGRGAQGNPWIFSELREYERIGVMKERPSPAQIRDMMLRHARLQMEFKGDYLGIREMRKHVAWYTTGYPHSARLRQMVNEIQTIAALEKSIMEIFA